MTHARSALSGCSFTALSSRELNATHSAVLQPFHLYGMAYIFVDLAVNHPRPPPSLHDRDGSSLPGCDPPTDVVDSESLVSI